MRQMVEGAPVLDCVLSGNKFKTAKIVLATTGVLTQTHPTALAIDPGAATKNVRMPLATSANEGLFFFIKNLGATTGLTLVMQTSTGGSTGKTVAINSCTLAVIVNGAWAFL